MRRRAPARNGRFTSGGTFTSLQDENGNAVGGINTDDEPVPKFVHRDADFLLLNPTQAPAFLFQGAPRCHPDVTMRLETPVLYFHPPASQPNAQGVNVKAAFRGGWLTEYFPAADATAPGVLPGSSGGFGHLTGKTVSTLSWNNLEVGGAWAGPPTDQHVWTAPRAVEAASVLGPHKEAEKFLFYRGVAHIDAPIRVARESDGNELALTGQWPPAEGDKPVKVRSLWLVDIQEDGKVAYRVVPALTLGGGAPEVVKTPGTFRSVDYSADNLAKLKAALHDALVEEGLFGDEANALLNTWELSYFKQPRDAALLPHAQDVDGFLFAAGSFGAVRTHAGDGGENRIGDGEGERYFAANRSDSGAGHHESGGAVVEGFLRGNRPEWQGVASGGYGTDFVGRVRGRGSRELQIVFAPGAIPQRAGIGRGEAASDERPGVR